MSLYGEVKMNKFFQGEGGMYGEVQVNEFKHVGRGVLCSGGGAEGKGGGPQVNKFEQVKVVVVVTWAPPPPLCRLTDRMTDMTENIIFARLRWRAVIMLCSV